MVQASGLLDPAVAEEEQNDKLVIIAWSGELDKMWPTLILATTSAAMGQETTVFFTFWGLFPLVKNDVRITGENWMQKMMSFMNRGGTDHLKLSKFHFAGAGKAMMMKLARDHKVASPTELMEMARDMGVHLVPCQMTMDLLGISREDLIDGVEEPIGATTALLEAKGATTFFI
ncbi:MAG TPA: DsrE/DsrF/DrsH-like family protein [Actinomycetota bacterium]|nr:DsrE/DsrF/DrsH-like family protein [Actinomycetota bacterium]